MATSNSTTSATTLPMGDAPTLKLVHATAQQAEQCQVLNSRAWKGPLSLEAYLRRERHLASQALTLNGGITHWILIDTADKSSDPVILASCETLRKKALVARRSANGRGTLEDVVSHGVGSVFCRDEFRGKGYAGRMMAELNRALETWQQKDGKKASFNVLYSDIGKNFYAKRGWKPFASSHVSLPAKTASSDPGSLKTRPLYANDLKELCDIDEKQLRRTMADFSGSTARLRVAFVPDIETIQWIHSREEFLAQELFQREPDVKGAILDGPLGKRAWCIFKRVFQAEAGESTLHIARLVVEDEGKFQSEAEHSMTNGTITQTDHITAIAACLEAAQVEAAKWDMTRVEVWNPAQETLHAVKKLEPSATLVHRDKESIASLLWYGSEVTPDEVEWVANEKYGWC